MARTIRLTASADSVLSFGCMLFGRNGGVHRQRTSGRLDTGTDLSSQAGSSGESGSADGPARQLSEQRLIATGACASRPLETAVIRQAMCVEVSAVRPAQSACLIGA